MACSMSRPAPIFSAAFAALKTGAIFCYAMHAPSCHAPGGQLAIRIVLKHVMMGAREQKHGGKLASGFLLRTLDKGYVRACVRML